jgi:secreted trypsin-like serine protease
MKKVVTAWVLTLALLLSVVGAASAVTDGVPDGEDHPMVVLLRMDTESGPSYRCSATLLSPTVVLTAGHCTSNYGYIEEEGDYVAMRVFTESDVENGNNTYPTCDGGNCVEAVDWAAHPLYETAPFWFHDIGVVILEEPGVVLASGEYGVLPDENQLDSMKTKRHYKDNYFTAVGYGLQKSFPTAAEWKEIAEKVRMVSYPHLIQINTPGFTGDFSLLLSNNTATGGTCFGDSGGPNFIGDSNVIAGVTSFGMNPTCAGTGGVFRVDRTDVLDFVNSYLYPSP